MKGIAHVSVCETTRIPIPGLMFVSTYMYICAYTLCVYSCVSIVFCCLVREATPLSTLCCCLGQVRECLPMLLQP